MEIRGYLVFGWFYVLMMAPLGVVTYFPVDRWWCFPLEVPLFWFDDGCLWWVLLGLFDVGGYMWLLSVFNNVVWAFMFWLQDDIG